MNRTTCVQIDYFTELEYDGNEKGTKTENSVGK
jgi:hypothetical protein